MVRSRRSSSGLLMAVLVMAVVAVLTVSVLLAQEHLGRGRITGEVTDETGIPVEGAKVTAQSLQGSAKLEGMTDKRGHFAIAGFGSGAWRITVSKPGYGDASAELNVAQLKTNPPVSIRIQKLTGVRGLRADKAGLDLLDQANGLIDQGNYDGALALLRDFQKKYPDIYQVRLSVATAYMKKGDSDKAEAEFLGVLEKIRQVHGDYAMDRATAVRALSGLGETALKKGDMAAGQGYFSQALAISLDDEGAAYNVGELLFSNQKTNEAIKYFELAAQIKKDWPKPYYKLGFVYLNKGDYDKSLESFNKFISLDPGNPEVPTVKTIIATIEKMKK